MAASDPGPAPPAVTVTVAPAPRSPPKYPDFCGRRRLQLEVQMLNREIGFLQEELQSLEGAQPVSRCCKDVNEFVGANPDPLIPITKKRHKSCGIWKWLRSKLCFCFSSACCSCGSCGSCGCSLHLKRPNCACPYPTCCACPYPTCSSCGDCQCRCPTCSCCKVSCCRPKCSCPEISCCRVNSCCPEISCCPVISCCPDISCCKPRCCRWEDFFCCPLPFCGCRRCRRRCCCFDKSCCKPRCSFPCSFPSLSCPEYSCGCIWSCPRCTDFQLCPKCTKTCCVSGCEC